MRDEQQEKSLHNDVREQTIGYITAALGLVAGLAWNDAVTGLIEFWYPAQKGDSVLVKFWYAAIITFAVVLVSNYLLRFARSEKTNN